MPPLGGARAALEPPVWALPLASLELRGHRAWGWLGALGWEHRVCPARAGARHRASLVEIKELRRKREKDEGFGEGDREMPVQWPRGPQGTGLCPP